MKTLLDLERYLFENALSLAVRCGISGGRRRWSATLTSTVLRIGVSEWAMDADDLSAAVDSAIEAHKAWTRVRA